MRMRWPDDDRCCDSNSTFFPFHRFHFAEDISRLGLAWLVKMKLIEMAEAEAIVIVTACFAGPK